MNRNKSLQIFTLIVFLLTTSFSPKTNELRVSGKFFSDDKKLNKQLARLHLFVMADNKMVAQTFTDSCGHYELRFTPGSEKSFDFLINSIGIDTTFIKTFTTFESDVITWDIKLPNSYINKHGQVLCPKCNKTDKVYPIIYGWEQKHAINIVKGDTTYNNIVDKKYYSGTCLISLLSPRYFCNRDKIKF